MKWATDEGGNVVVCPLTGFHVAPMAEIAVLARIEFARSPDQLEKNREALQLGLSPAIALQLAADLRRAAEHILALPSPEKTN